MMNDRPRDSRSQDRPLDRDLSAAARRYHEPPATPREAMWDKIQAARGGEELPRADQPAPPRIIPLWQRRVVLWPAAAAAILLLGIAIGRFGLSGDGAPGDLGPVTNDLARTEVPAMPDNPAAVNRSGDNIYRLAATPLLGRSETLLLQMATGAGEMAGQPMFSSRAAVLLAETRLLLQSPAADDADLKTLLEDLELTLARIVTIAEKQWVADQQVGEEPAAGRSVLEEGLDRQSILPRLRSHLAAGTSSASL